MLARLTARFVVTAGLIAMACVPGALAETRITLKSAATSSSYYMMTVQIAEALKQASGGELAVTVEESQGSVQNVKEAARRTGNYIFTSPPGLVAGAKAGKKPFEGESGYESIRALFPMPFITMHFVVRADSGVTSLEELAGKDFIGGGRGTFGQRQTKAIFDVLGLTDKVNLVDVELSAADNAVRNRRVIGYSTAGSHPAPNVLELAAGTPIRLLGFTPGQLRQVLAADPGSAAITIPAGTYAGVDYDVQTVSLPVGAYTTGAMSEDTAYAVTRAFWQRRDEMAKQNPWWSAVTADMAGRLGEVLHPGAMRYYREVGIAVPAGQ